MKKDTYGKSLAALRLVEEVKKADTKDFFEKKTARVLTRFRNRIKETKELKNNIYFLDLILEKVKAIEFQPEIIASLIKNILTAEISNAKRVDK